jgi:Fur family ferric uptake transcriptional regulator
MRLKNTKHRASILEVMQKSEKPLTAEQVFLELKEKDPSEYFNCLQNAGNLEEKELITKLNIAGENRTMFGTTVNCTGILGLPRMQKILAINGCPLERYEKPLRKKPISPSRGISSTFMDIVPNAEAGT